MIRKLPVHVANKIAAGEVIERPASVVKELVENALDAGAQRILVEIEEGGKKLIRVQDDGCGISAEELPLALAPHATSKIHSVEDLFEILSFGFRGEALASIGSVARCRITSRRRGEPLGHRVECERSEISEVIEAGGPEGTVVEVRDLFHSTPARRKFLKSDSAEIARINEILTRVVMPLSDVSVELRHNGRKVIAIESAENLERRLIRLFGRDLDGKLLAVQGERDGIRLSGYIGLPEVAKKVSNRQFLFLNDRFIKDRSLSHAVARGYEGFLMHRRYPVFFLELTIDPKLVDVNVHPTKSEVRFRNRSAVFSVIQGACRQALALARPTGGLLAEARNVREVAAGTAESPPAQAPSARERVVAMENSLFPSAARDRAELVQEVVNPSYSDRIDSAAGGPVEDIAAAALVSALPNPENKTSDEKPLGAFLQIHNSYLLVEDEAGFYVVDQHALHERMLYEQLRERASRGEISVQRLLVPDVVELGALDHQRLLGMQKDLAGIGVEVSDFGGHAIAVEALPTDLAKVSGRKIIEAILATDDRASSEALGEMRLDILAHRACRAAVKFSDALSDVQIQALLEWEQQSENSAACPHGRPTRLRISMSELERRFMRKE
ncbi:MAG: DNA mismatch repair endonuclease MutL [Planctomycetota bacterium]